MKRLIIFSVAGVVLGLLYGAAMERYKLFPREQIRGLVHWYKSDQVDPDTRTIRSIFFDIEVTRHQSSGRAGVGAIESLGDRVIGTDRLGKFFVFWRDEHGMPQFAPLEIEIETGYEHFVRHAQEVGASVVLDWFRVHDIVFDPRKNRLIVSHHYWSPTDNCSTVRLSVTEIAGGVDALTVVTPGDWTVVYETQPCIALQKVGNPFEGLQAGGRLALRGDSEVVITIGDHGLDGFQGTENAPQDPLNSYGKIWSIDLNAGDTKIISLGHRNPQGLLIDDAGRIWATEHGPRGGDELNLINEGKNYGWPYVTYGTQYGDYGWPNSSDEEQGRHLGYQSAAFAWIEAIAVSNLIQSTNFHPAWEGDLIVSSLRARSLYRLRYEDGRIIFADKITIGERIRDLVKLADGTMILWTEESGIVELRPIEYETSLSGYIDSLELSPTLSAEVQSTIQLCLQCHENSRTSVSRPGAGDGSLFKPNLWNVVNRPIGSTDYPLYSDSIRVLSGNWDEVSLDRFLSNPNEFAPGTTMSFGVADSNVRREVITYLKTLR